MMRTLQPKQASLFAYDVNLELRIASDHPLRSIKRTLDLSFVDPLVEKTYGRSGHQSIPPQTILRMLFLLFYYNIPSERELCAQIGVRLDFLWFLDLDLDSPVPHHSVLSKARARWGGDVFQELFVRTVQQCVQAGLVEGKLLHIDSTIVAANASKDSIVKTSPELVAALRRVCQEQEQKLEIVPAPPELPAASAELPLSAPASGAAEKTVPVPALTVLPVLTTTAETAAAEPRPAAAEPEPASAFQPQIVSSTSAGAVPNFVPEGKPGIVSKNVPVNENHISLTDPEAELARDKSGVTRLCYKEHRMVDDRCGVITAVKVTGSTAPDGAQLPSMYAAHQSATGLQTEQPAIAADKHYGTASNYRYCLAAGLRPHMGQAVNGVRGRGLFGPDQFCYEPEHDRFRCPAGQVLVLHQRRPEIQCNSYLIERAELCAHCPLQKQCTQSERGRSLQVAQDHLVIEAARAEAASPAARQSRRRRRHVMEGSFADAMNNHGAKRSRWRRRAGQSIQSWMIALVQNIRILAQERDQDSSSGAVVLPRNGHPCGNLTITSAKLPKSTIPRFPNAICRRIHLDRARRPVYFVAEGIRHGTYQRRKPALAEPSWATRPHLVSYGEREFSTAS